MGLFLQQESIPKLERVSDSAIRLPASASSPAVINFGGQQKVFTSPLVCDPNSVGLGGIDVGAPVAQGNLSIYLVKVGGVFGLISSLSEIAPLGFDVNTSRFLGIFSVNHQPVFGGLLRDHNREAQPILFRAQTPGSFGFGPNGSYRRIPFNFVNASFSDTHKILDDSIDAQFYIPETRRYKFLSEIGYGDSGVGFTSYVQMCIFINETGNDSSSTNILRFTQDGHVTGSPFPGTQIKTDFILLQKGDLVDFRAFQNTGAVRSELADNRRIYGEIFSPSGPEADI